MSKNDYKILGVWIKRFLLEYLIIDRNLSENTQRSYRDTFVLFMPFMGKHLNKKIDLLTINQVTPELIRSFLEYMEKERRCGAATRNQRLSAIHSLALFISERSPEYIDWCRQIRNIHFKKVTQAVVPYLEKEEMDALLNAPNRNTTQGQRDYAILLFLYNTGARASEVANVIIDDLNIIQCSSIKILGKGNKVRICPLWKSTVQELRPLINKRNPSEPIFMNRYKKHFSRFGIHSLVERYSIKAAIETKSLLNKRVSPHVIRHTTAVHLLRAGVDINTIRAWLGHVSINTTNIYAEVDLAMKSKALSLCEITGQKINESNGGKWGKDQNLMKFLSSL